VNSTSKLPRVVALLAAGLVAALLAGCATGQADTGATVSIVPAAAQTVQTLLSVDGLDRTVTIRDIEDAANALVPALILMHGAGGSSEKMEGGTGMTGIAEDNGFVVAYPDGTSTEMPVGGQSWNAGSCCAAPVAKDIDDAAFISAVIDELVANHGVDPERVYIGGFSNGGMMSYRSACEFGDRIAGIVVVGGALNVTGCDAPSELPVLIIHGTADATVPYGGGVPNANTAARLGSWVNASVADAVSYWSGRNDCTSHSTVTDDGTITDEKYAGCLDGSGLEVVSILGGTHRWPTTKSEDFNASKYIAEFFGLAA
jgi:polyhydroxybutyrate depolymerase